MKKIELLAPAGSMESLIAAVNNGADAVYMGGIAFGARAYANNFDRNSIIEAINFCHVRGINVYITMNTLIYENEIEKAIEEVDFYYKNQVDALIVQDIGLFNIIRKMYPELDVHCSTQMHIHNVNGVKFMKENGASRVILARETPLEIIKECVKTGIEIETFSYGALCMSYSGQCMMSSILQGRSGNRGVCAQHCRLQYKIFDTDDSKYLQSDEYLLSPKDLNLINRIPELIDAGVSSLKIEGRMKRSEYVGLVVNIFRKAIDSYYEGKEYKLNNKDLKKLKLLFNRGFTEGKTFDNNDNSFMNRYRPNHIGVNIGKVVSFSKDLINIELSDELNQGDGIRIINSNEDFGLVVNKLYYNNKLVNKGIKSQVVSIEKKGRVNKGDEVLKTTDILLNKEIAINNNILARRIKLNAKVFGKVNQPLKLEISDGINIVKVESEFICEKPLKSSVTFEKIKEQLNKTNDTPYSFIDINGDIEGIFINLKSINELRRKALDQLNILRINKYKRSIPKEYILEDIKEDTTLYNIYEINNKEHLKNIEVNNSLLFSNSLDMLNYNKEVNFLGYIVNENSVGVNTKYLMASQIGDLYDSKSILLASFSLNASNSYAVAFLLENGCVNVCYSLELNEEKIRRSEEAFFKRFNFYPNTSTFVYGRRDLMITKQRVVYPSVSNKPAQLSHNFQLENKKKQRFSLSIDNYGFTHILEDEIYKLDNYITKSKYIRLNMNTK